MISIMISMSLFLWKQLRTNLGENKRTLEATMLRAQMQKIGGLDAVLFCTPLQCDIVPGFESI